MFDSSYDNYPRVLFITPCAFNQITGGGVTFSNLFKDWPKNKIATITGDAIPVSKNVCDNYYFLTSKDLNYKRPFTFLLQKSNSSGEKRKKLNSLKNTKYESIVIRLARRLIGDAGIPDQGFLSADLKNWIQDYQPQIIYTILGSPGYIDIVSKVQDELNIPLVIHLMDEGVTDPRRKGFFGSYLHRLYKHKLTEVLNRSSCRMAICQEMAIEYTKRYRRKFIHFQNTVDISKWKKYQKKEIDIKNTPRLIYAGSILPFSQQRSLKDCCQVIKEINEKGNSIQLDIYTPLELLNVPIDYFEIHPAINVRAIPEDDAAFFSILGKADGLLLPVNFDPKSVHYIRLSMPTKVPAYLSSGTPILVYGPPEVAQVRYALQYGWGLVVTQKNEKQLENAIRRIITNFDLRQSLSETAGKVAGENHDAPKVRIQFQRTLCDLVGEN